MIGFFNEENKQNESPIYLYGIPVMPISHLLDYRKDALVIIAAEARFTKEIYPALQKYGFENIEMMF